MNYELLTALRAWRDEQARIEGVEGYRVLNNAALEELARALPQDRDALCSVKGIKDAKYRRYGKSLLALIGEYTDEGAAESKLEGVTEVPITIPETLASPAEPLSVSQFLDSLNLELSGLAARVRGEVSSVDIRERVVYFTLKDSIDESIVNCLVFRYQYEVSGVKLAIGDEVIVEGAPDIYKPSGRLSLKVGVIEYAGIGELKKAYDALHKKLELSGAFASQRKRPIPEFAERIALITSREGAAIGDFTMNLARAGIRVDFYPTLVEGKKAVFEIIKAIRYFNQAPERYDALVIIRGGGSLESLQAFNTEALVNEVVASAIPVLAGIGHERDVSLAALAADHMVSTPTATARHLSASWDEARASLGKQAAFLERAIHEFQTEIQTRVRKAEEGIRGALDSISERTALVHAVFRERVAIFPAYCRQIGTGLGSSILPWQARLDAEFVRIHDRLKVIDKRLRQYDPMRALQLGYALVRKRGAIIRLARGVAIGDRIDIQLGSGSIESEVTSIREI